MWEDLKEDVLQLAKKEKPVGETRAWTNAFMLSLSGKIMGEERRKYFERLLASTNDSDKVCLSASEGCLSNSEYVCVVAV